MNPMTELDVLKGLQSSMFWLDLDEPMAVERAMALGASIERCAGRIISAAEPTTHHTGNDAMRAAADEPPFSEEPFAADIARTIAARRFADALARDATNDLFPVNNAEEDAQMDAIEQAHPAPCFAPLDVIDLGTGA